MPFLLLFSSHCSYTENFIWWQHYRHCLLFWAEFFWVICTKFEDTQCHTLFFSCFLFLHFVSWPISRLCARSKRFYLNVKGNKYLELNCPQQRGVKFHIGFVRLFITLSADITNNLVVAWVFWTLLVKDHAPSVPVSSINKIKQNATSRSHRTYKCKAPLLNSHRKLLL